MASYIRKRLSSDLSITNTLSGIDYAEITDAIVRGISTNGTYIYVTDTSNHRLIQFLAADLSYVDDVGGFGSGNDQFSSPRFTAVVSNAPAPPVVIISNSSAQVVW